MSRYFRHTYIEWRKRVKMAICLGGIQSLWNAYMIQAFVLLVSSHGTLHFGGILMLLLAYFLRDLEACGLMNVLPCDQYWNANKKFQFIEKRQQEWQNTGIQIGAHITHSTNGNTEKWILCIACQLFRAQDCEHTQGFMNRISVISDKRKDYLKQIWEILKIISIRMKAKHFPFL
jgi:hypothetical protein